MKKKGFTLIELLVVIAIIAILAGIVIIAVNPARQVGQARNAQRRADVLTTLNAIYQFYLDNGNFPAGIDTGYKQLGTAVLGTAVGTCNDLCGDGWTLEANCLDLSSALVPTYISNITKDPQGTAEETMYAVHQDAQGRITIRACNLEIVKDYIEVTR